MINRRFILHKGQRQILKTLTNVRHPGIFAEMRVGKTLPVIRNITSYETIEKILIIAKYEVLYDWIETLQTEKHNIKKLFGSKPERLKKLYSQITGENTFYLLNWEGFLVIPEIKDFNFDAVILDESIAIKNPKSKVSKFFVKNFRDVKKRIILTGDPTPNGSDLEYYQQLKFLDYGLLPYKSYYEFRAKCFRPDFVGYNFKITKKGKKILNCCLQHNCSFVTRNDCGFENKKIYIKKVIPFSKQMKKIYNTLCDEFILELNDHMYKKSIYAINKTLWLRRLCGGFYDKKFIWNDKIKLLMDTIKDLKNQKIIVWATFTNEQHRIKLAIDKQGFTSEVLNGENKKSFNKRMIKSFQNGNIDILILQPSCFKHGIDLSRANTEIYYSQCNGSDDRNQSEDRLVNINRKEGILIIDLLIEDSFEIDVLDSHLQKKKIKNINKIIINNLQKGIK